MGKLQYFLEYVATLNWFVPSPLIPVLASLATLTEADHLCVASRGVKDTASFTRTSYYGGKFKQAEVKQEFLGAVK